MNKKLWIALVALQFSAPVSNIYAMDSTHISPNNQNFLYPLLFGATYIRILRCDEGSRSEKNFYHEKIAPDILKLAKKLDRDIKTTSNQLEKILSEIDKTTLQDCQNTDMNKFPITIPLKSFIEKNIPEQQNEQDILAALNKTLELNKYLSEFFHENHVAAVNAKQSAMANLVAELEQCANVGSYIISQAIKSVNQKTIESPQKESESDSAPPPFESFEDRWKELEGRAMQKSYKKTISQGDCLIF